MALSNTSGTFNAGYFTTTKPNPIATGPVFGSNNKTFTTGTTTTTGTLFTGTGTTTILNGGWTFSTPSLGPGEWVCRQCGGRFYIVDDQPTIEKRIEQIDLTTFGSITRQYTTQEHIELYCSSCRP